MCAFCQSCNQIQDRNVCDFHVRMYNKIRELYIKLRKLKQLAEKNMYKMMCILYINVPLIDFSGDWSHN